MKLRVRGTDSATQVSKAQLPVSDRTRWARGLTCVTFSVTLWVRSMSLQGAMISISPVGRAMSGSGLKSTKLRVIWGILEMARYLTRSESDVELNMLDLLFTAPANTDTLNRRWGKHLKSWSAFPPVVSLTGAAAAQPDARSPVLSVPVRPHGLNLIHRGGATHAVEALPWAAVRQWAVGGRAVRVEAEAVVRCYTRWRLGERSSKLGSVWGRRRMGYRRVRLLAGV